MCDARIAIECQLGKFVYRLAAKCSSSPSRRDSLPLFPHRLWFLSSILVFCTLCNVKISVSVDSSWEHSTRRSSESNKNVWSYAVHNTYTIIPRYISLEHNLNFSPLFCYFFSPHFGSAFLEVDVIWAYEIIVLFVVCYSKSAFIFDMLPWAAAFVILFRPTTTIRTTKILFFLFFFFCFFRL